MTGGSYACRRDRKAAVNASLNYWRDNAKMYTADQVLEVAAIFEQYGSPGSNSNGARSNWPGASQCGNGI